MNNIVMDGLDELRKQLDPDIFNKAFNTTANEIVTSVFNKSKTQIKKKWNIDIKSQGKNTWAFASKTTGKVNKRNGHMRIIKATKKDGNIYVWVQGTPLNLSLFEYSWKQEVSSTKSLRKKKAIGKKMKSLGRKGRGLVRVKILKSEVTTLKSAFVATMNRSGHKGVFQRSSKSSLPILEKRTVTPTTMFEQVGFNKMLDDAINERLLSRFEHNLERLSSGYWKK